MKLKDLMITGVVQATPEQTIAAAADAMRKKSVGCLVVTLSASIKGIITDRDLLSCLVDGHEPFRCKVSTHMQRPVTVLAPEETAATAIHVMHEKGIKRLPIASKGQLLGIISLSDLAGHAQKEIEELRPSLEFFTSVVRAQSARRGKARLAPGDRPQAPAPERGRQLEAVETGSELINAGGPG